MIKAFSHTYGGLTRMAAAGFWIVRSMEGPREEQS